MNKIIKYLPPFLQPVREYKEICSTEDIELDKIDTEISKMLDEVIVNRASSYGLERYEKIYNISEISDNLEERRFNILSRMNNRVPFTLNWLDNKLKTLVGENNYRISVNYNEYAITIDVAMLFENIANSLNITLRQQLPANMLITVNLFQTEKSRVFVSAIMQEGEYMTIGGR